MSHLDFANQSKYASQSASVIQPISASYWEIVTQGKDASQLLDANQSKFASPRPSLQPKTGGDMCGVGKW